MYRTIVYILCTFFFFGRCFSSTDNCTGEYTSNRGTIQSPYFPSPSPHNLNCTWHIHVSSDRVFVLDIEEFGTEKSFDYLVILDRNTNKELWRLSGSCVAAPLYTETNSITLRYQTDISVLSTGFRLSYTTYLTNSNFTGETLAQVISTCGICPEKFISTSGTINSLYYPTWTFTNNNCSWYIYVFYDLAIEIEIENLEITPCCDSFTVVDNNMNQQLWRLLNSTNGTFETGTNNITITLTTSGSASIKGFRLHYRTYLPNDTLTTAGQDSMSSETTDSTIDSSTAWPSTTTGTTTTSQWPKTIEDTTTTSKWPKTIEDTTTTLQWPSTTTGTTTVPQSQSTTTGTTTVPQWQSTTTGTTTVPQWPRTTEDTTTTSQWPSTTTGTTVTSRWPSTTTGATITSQFAPGDTTTTSQLQSTTETSSEITTTFPTSPETSTALLIGESVIGAKPCDVSAGFVNIFLYFVLAIDFINVKKNNLH